MPNILMPNTHIGDGVYCQIELGGLLDTIRCVLSTEISRPITLEARTFDSLLELFEYYRREQQETANANTETTPE